ncbi:hypothetical protein [Micromonospora coxensis]|uniref:hypothetical protein n=1 Tax=Micromonospora coxensis TaxID=356852 RepID=UPI003419DD04
MSLALFSPSPAFAADADDPSIGETPTGVSPDAEPGAAPVDEDGGPLPDYSGLADDTYVWVAELDGSMPRGDGSVADAEGSSTAPGQVSTFAVWGACGIFTDNHKLVRAFSRKAARTTSGAPGSLPGGTSNLKCGSEKWGYRHIVKRHLSQWENDAKIERKNWRDLADFAIGVALSDPDAVTYRKSNDTYCFSREIYLVDKRTGRVVAYRYPNVSIAAKSKNIITAYPAGAQCR